MSDRTQLERDIALLDQASKSDTIDPNQRAAILEELDIAIAEYEALPPPEVSKPAKVHEPAGLLGSYGLGVERQMGRFSAGISDAASLTGIGSGGFLSPESMAERQQIAESEREAEEVFRARTADHPIAAGLGEATPFLPLAAGGTPGMAFTRGALAGSLSYTDDLSERALQAGVGGAANIGGRQLLGAVRPRSPGGKAQALGMKTLPEQRGPVLFRESAQSMEAFARASNRTLAKNRDIITRHILRDAGVQTKRFTHDTLNDIEKRAGALFERAKGNKTNMILDKSFVDDLNIMFNRNEEAWIQAPKVKGIIRRVIDKIDSSGGMMNASEYQARRSELTTAMRDTKKRGTKRQIGIIRDALDAKAEAGFANSDTLKYLREARSLWDKSSTLSKKGIIDWNTGQINPVKMRSVLASDDHSGYLLNRRKTPLYEMLRMDELTPLGTGTGEPLVASRVGGVPVTGRRLTSPIESLGLGASRLPVRAAEGAPLGAAVPQVGGLLREDQ